MERRAVIECLITDGCHALRDDHRFQIFTSLEESGRNGLQPVREHRRRELLTAEERLFSDDSDTVRNGNGFQELAVLECLCTDAGQPIRENDADQILLPCQSTCPDHRAVLTQGQCGIVGHGALIAVEGGTHIDRAVRLGTEPASTVERGFTDIGDGIRYGDILERRAGSECIAAKGMDCIRDIDACQLVAVIKCVAADALQCLRECHSGHIARIKGMVCDTGGAVTEAEFLLHGTSLHAEHHLTGIDDAVILRLIPCGIRECILADRIHAVRNGQLCKRRASLECHRADLCKRIRQGDLCQCGAAVEERRRDLCSAADMERGQRLRQCFAAVDDA